MIGVSYTQTKKLKSMDKLWKKKRNKIESENL